MGSCVSSHFHTEISFNHHDIPMKCSPSTLQESADETFFDTQAWLESDCEEDFRSVNGEFAPSGGNTPLHTGGQDLKPEQSLLHIKRKTLSDLFEESVGDQNVKYFLTTDNTVHSCERMLPPYRETKTGREKSVRSLQCCFTGRSYVEGKKNNMAPVPLS